MVELFYAEIERLKAELDEQRKVNLELSVDFHTEKNRLKAELDEARRIIADLKEDVNAARKG